MAAIAGSGGSSVAGSAATAGTATGPSTPASPGGECDAPEAFTRVIAQILGTEDSTAQTSTACPVSITIQPSPELPAESDDSHVGDDAPDEAASVLAALLPGFACPAASPDTGTAPGADVAKCAIDAPSPRGLMPIDVSQIALETLTDDGSDTQEPHTDAPVQAEKPSAASSHGSAQVSPLHSPTAAQAARSNAPAASGEIHAQVGTPAWQDELGAQLTWMAVNGREAASLRLSPEHLGPLEVRISVQDGQASVYFNATHADTRSALEQSLPRLRELFAAQGIILADAGVSRDAPRNAFKSSARPAAVSGVSDAAAEQRLSSVALSRVGLVDTYV